MNFEKEFEKWWTEYLKDKPEPINPKNAKAAAKHFRLQALEDARDNRPSPIIRDCSLFLDWLEAEISKLKGE